MTSARSAWAVGYTGGRSLRLSATLILRWNGAAWTRVPSPSPERARYLFGIAAASARNAWAVGWTAPTPRGQDPDPAVERHGMDSSAQSGPCSMATFSPAWPRRRRAAPGWSGKAHPGRQDRDPALERPVAWTRVPSPTPARGSASLNHVAATSARSAWAVGPLPVGSPNPKALILRWNGTGWEQVPSPDRAGPAILYGVAATSARDAWAVGYTGGFGRTLILHWNGSAWK